MQQRTAPNISIRALVIACEIALALGALYLMGLPAVWLVVIGAGAALFRTLRFMGALTKRSASKNGEPPAVLKQPDNQRQIGDETIIAVRTPQNKLRRIEAKTPGEQAVFGVLQKIIVEYGPEVLENSSQCERLIRERCDALTSRTGIATRREATVLVTALNEGLPQRLAASDSMLNGVAISSHATMLSDASGLDPAAAFFAVDSWAAALDLRSAT